MSDSSDDHDIVVVEVESLIPPELLRNAEHGWALALNMMTPERRAEALDADTRLAEALHDAIIGGSDD